MNIDPKDLTYLCQLLRLRKLLVDLLREVLLGLKKTAFRHFDGENEISDNISG